MSQRLLSVDCFGETNRNSIHVQTYKFRNGYSWVLLISLTLNSPTIDVREWGNTLHIFYLIWRHTNESTHAIWNVAVAFYNGYTVKKKESHWLTVLKLQLTFKKTFKNKQESCSLVYCVFDVLYENYKISTTVCQFRKFKKIWTSLMFV